MSLNHYRYMSSSVPTKCIINGTELEKVEIIKDLGVCYDSYLLFDKPINDKIVKAYGILGLIKRSFANGSKDCFLLLYKSIVRSNLEYANSITPRRISDIEKLEKVQKRAAKLIHWLDRLNYVERLQLLNYQY